MSYSLGSALIAQVAGAELENQTALQAILTGGPLTLII